MSVFNRWPIKTGGFCLAFNHIKIVIPARWHTATPAQAATPSPPHDGYAVTPAYTKDSFGAREQLNRTNIPCLISSG